jgi:hypothetical protein
LGFDRSRVRPWVADMEPEAVQTRRGGTSEIGPAEPVLEASHPEGEGRQGSAEEVLDLASLSAHLMGDVFLALTDLLIEPTRIPPATSGNGMWAQSVSKKAAETSLRPVGRRQHCDGRWHDVPFWDGHGRGARLSWCSPF